MFSATRRIFLFLLLRLIITDSWNAEETSKTVDQLLGSFSQRLPRDSDNDSPIWLDYEFNSGVGNREELVVTNVVVHQYSNLSKETGNRQFFQVNGTSYLLCVQESYLSLYELDLDNVRVSKSMVLDIEGHVLTFKVISLNFFDVVIVLCVRSYDGTSLRWYRFVSGVPFQLFWSWPVQKHVQSMEFLQHEEGNKLLFLDEDEIHFGQQYSPIDVYDFSIDFSTHAFHFWLRQRTIIPKIYDIRVCSIYENVLLALRGMNDIFLYEYRDTTSGSIFQELQTIKSHDMRNFVCFESGYLQFMGISGPEAGLFHFIEDEFQYNTESESNFDTSEISWITDVRVDTYRDESLLLLQLKNTTVIALAWQGLSFKRIQLPSNVLDQFDLSTITPVPKLGFFVGDQLVKFHTELKELKHPIQYTMEKVLILQRLLNNSLNYQEKVLDETEARIEKSYLKNTVTGFWNLSMVNSTDAVISDKVGYHMVTIGSKNLTREDLKNDVNVYVETLKDVEWKLNEIDSNIMNTINTSSTELHFDSVVEVFGNINITGSLNVGNLTAKYINDVNVMDKFESNHEENTIEDTKTFSSIEPDNLPIYSLNGIPVEYIRFSDSMRNYQNVNFSKITRAHVDGHLSFTTINGVHWNTLMKNVVWKNQPAYIPGDTVIEGTLNADLVDLDVVNNLRYPEDYVLTESDTTIKIEGKKSFDKLLLPRLNGVKTLNDIDFEDFVIINKDNVLDKEIMFENLVVEGQLQIDGEINGSEEKEIKFLNETTEWFTDVTFLNLNVLGNVTFDTLFLNKRPVNFEDLLLKSEENVEITGTKTFLGEVRIKSNMTVRSGLVNGHFLDEFVTLDTEQELPNLMKILSNVTFGNVTYGATKKLETFLSEHSNSSYNCLEKIIVFKSPITVDALSFDKLNNDVTYEDFQTKLNETFNRIRFNNLTADTLFAGHIASTTINGIDYFNLTNILATEEHEVDRIETDHLNATFINEMSLAEINELMDRINETLTEIFTGNTTLDSVRVTGTIKADSVNGVSLEDLYKKGEIGTVIFEEGVDIKNLTILGLINGFNFSERVADAVLKTDTNIVIDAHKTFDVVNCAYLETTLLNGRPVEKLLDPLKEQVLTGPVVINGSVTVLKKFNATGRINDLPFHELIDKFQPLDNNTYEFHGDVHFNNQVTIENLYTNGSIQGRNFDSFLNSIVFKNKDNVTLSGRKVFEGNVTFNRAFIVHDHLNEIDLKRFHEKAVFIDKPFSVESKIVFKDGIEVENDLIVETSFETKSIMGVDIEDLRFNVLYLNRPTYIADPITFTNVTFQSDINVENFNTVDMNLLIPLKTEQTIDVDILRCRTVNVENIQVLGKINGHDLKQVRETTFMVNGNQNITGHFKFHGDVRMRHNFNARLLNGIDPKKIVSIHSKSELKGNFVFEKPVYFNQSLRVLGYLNNIDPARWEAVAVTKNNRSRQTVSGTWTVRGNVYLEKGAYGSDILNGTNLTEISNVLASERLNMDAVLAEKNANLMSMCEDLRHLKFYAERQIYQFSTFDYLQVIEFEGKIVSVHYFELAKLDYMILSFDTCHMHTYMFTGTKFVQVANVADFGVVERWTTFKHDETLYFLTTGNDLCGRSSVNLWKLEKDEFTYVLDLGDSVNNGEVNEDAFLTLINRNEQLRSSQAINENLKELVSSLKKEDDVKIVLEEDQMLLTSNPGIYEYNVDQYNNNSLRTGIKRPEVLNFKAGALEKEMILYYDEDISKDRVFIFSNGPTRKILQTIKVHRPTCFTILNFEGLIETLLVFTENKRNLRVYEYKGIQGFVYRDSIRMNVDRLISFKIRKHTDLAKRHCLALIHDNRLTILQAKMYGEKLEMQELSCPTV